MAAMVAAAAQQRRGVAIALRDTGSFPRPAAPRPGEEAPREAAVPPPRRPPRRRGRIDESGSGLACSPVCFLCGLFCAAAALLLIAHELGGLGGGASAGDLPALQRALRPRQGWLHPHGAGPPVPGTPGGGGGAGGRQLRGSTVDVDAPPPQPPAAPPRGAVSPPPATPPRIAPRRDHPGGGSTGVGEKKIVLESLDDLADDPTPDTSPPIAAGGPSREGDSGDANSPDATRSPQALPKPILQLPNLELPKALPHHSGRHSEASSHRDPERGDTAHRAEGHATQHHHHHHHAAHSAGHREGQAEHAAAEHASDDADGGDEGYHVGQKVRATTQLRMQNGQRVDVGMVGEVTKVDGLAIPGSVGRVLINGVLFDARPGEVEPADTRHGAEAVGSFESLEKRLEKVTPRRRWGPDPAPHFAAAAEATGCDMLTVPFRAESDERCLAYMANQSNWADLRPMTQKFDERTVKFKVRFRHKPLRAIIKVPQRLFPYEPTSEVGSFHADRVMQINRVPPTAWAQVPVETLKKAVHEHAKEVGLVDRFAREAHVKDFEAWVDEEFFSFSRERGLLEGDTIGVSVQLFIADVRPLLGSDLSIPWTPHDPGWQRTLDPGDVGFGAKHAAAYIRQAELAMYDFVLGNGDRSPNKNNFVVGACRHRRHLEECGNDPEENPRHPGPPNFLTLDNGMTFMYRLTPDRSPDGPNPLLSPKFCTFYRPLLQRLHALRSKGSTQPFAEQMAARLPPHVLNTIRKRNLQKCQQRIADLLKQADKCLGDFPEHSVIYS
eukprot:TRINITY_DN4305_c1_g1_i1.p1 TRINITY_DN4305_c1_g1~~TRINITY_DN4305_c1_g1_i1.p1  ORF type:complete len:816 (+),score=264.68 TRINITY_DN4305_c1_g1_i1:109-2448(+)